MNATVKRWGVPALAGLGLADALYLASLHLIGEAPACGSYGGCEQVNSSPYAEVFGIPVAALGSLLYLAIFVATLARLGARGQRRDDLTLAIYGMLVSAAVFMAYLTWLEFFVIHAFCYWCLALAAITLTLLVISVRELPAMGGRQTRRHAGRA